MNSIVTIFKISIFLILSYDGKKFDNIIYAVIYN